MKSLIYILLLGLLMAMPQCTWAQEAVLTGESRFEKPMDPLAPARASFYSSVVPGLGQIYNKKYWKLPLVYGAIGVPVYFYADNQKNYKKFRNEYKKRLKNIQDPNDPFFGRLDDARIIQGQQVYQRNRDLSAVVAAGFYILTMIDANVDAHLIQFNVSDKLSLQPAIDFSDLDHQYRYGLSLQYQF